MAVQIFVDSQFLMCLRRGRDERGYNIIPGERVPLLATHDDRAENVRSFNAAPAGEDPDLSEISGGGWQEMADFSAAVSQQVLLACR